MQKERVGIFRTQVVITRIAPEEPRMAVYWAAGSSIVCGIAPPDYCVPMHAVNAGLTTEKYTLLNKWALDNSENVSSILHGCVERCMCSLDIVCAQNHKFW